MEKIYIRVILIKLICIWTPAIFANTQTWPDSAVVMTYTHSWAATGEMSGNRISVRDSKNNIHSVYFMKWGIPYADSSEIFYVFSSDNGLTWSTPENVSNTDSLESVEPGLVIDSKDQLHCVWRQYSEDTIVGYYDLFYAKRDSSGWTQAINISNQNENSNTSFYSSMVVDSKDNLHVVWDHGMGSGNWDIFYTCYNGTTWTNPYQISNSPFDDAFPALTVDQNDVLHLVWRQRTSGGPILYCYKDSLGWSIPEIINTIPGPDSYSSTIVADSKCQPHVVWNWGTEIYYTYFNGNQWVLPFNISQTSTGSVSPSLAIDSVDHLYAVWQEGLPNSHGDILYRVFDGDSWSDIVNLTQDTSSSGRPKLGNPVSTNGIDLIWVGPNTSSGILLLYLKLSLVGLEEIRHKGQKDIDIRVRPNPFIDKVSIEYNLTSAEDLNITILDVSGRVIERFEQKWQVSGSHRFIWHAKHQPAGVYFLMFDVGGKRLPIRLVKIK